MCINVYCIRRCFEHSIIQRMAMCVSIVLPIYITIVYGIFVIFHALALLLFCMLTAPFLYRSLSRYLSVRLYLYNLFFCFPLSPFCQSMGTTLSIRFMFHCVCVYFSFILFGLVIVIILFGFTTENFIFQAFPDRVCMQTHIHARTHACMYEAMKFNCEYLQYFSMCYVVCMLLNRTKR